MSNLLNKIKEFFETKDNLKYPDKLRNNGQCVFEYSFVMSLDEKEYPKYLKDSYYIKFGQKLNLRHPKNINEKIQWLKIYDNLPIKTQLTDKVLVRDWVKDKIGEEYLKPVLWIGDNFDDIPFDDIPEPFLIKCNHGCKWQFVIKNKSNFLNSKKIYNYTKVQIDHWMKESFFGWSDFETQYKNIKPKILVEPQLLENSKFHPQEVEVWCFNGSAKIIQKSRESDSADFHKIVNSYDENFNFVNIKFFKDDEIVNEPCDEILKKAKSLSEILAKDFKFVRVDWLIYKNHLYFQEMTFTPYSGFIVFPKNNVLCYNKLGDMLKLKG